LGSGHLRRAQLLADALAEEGAAVTLVNGGPPGPWPAAPGVELVQLPPITAPDGDFRNLVDATGAPVSATLRAQRQHALVDLLLSRRPQAVITEMFPFGRRWFRGELLPLIEAAATQHPRPLVVASVRDVLVSKPDPASYAWMAELARAHYDKVLVHGDERLLPFSLSFPLAGSLGGRLVHTGFVHAAAPVAPDTTPPPAVLVSAGGGAVGERLLRVALEARAASGHTSAAWLLVGGQNLPDATFAALQALAPTGCTLVRYRADLATLTGRCAVSVSQAGYNTVVEGLMAGARMVLVPFAVGGEDEQTRRAERLRALGVAEVVAEAGLTPGALAAAIDRIAVRPRPRNDAWSFDGAKHSAALLRAMVEERRR
jgi:predicted glycosyltransferase